MINFKSSPFLNGGRNRKSLITRVKSLFQRKPKIKNEDLTQEQKDKIWNDIQESNRKLDERIAKGPTSEAERRYKIPRSRNQSRLKPYLGS